MISLQHIWATHTYVSHGMLACGGVVSWGRGAELTLRKANKKDLTDNQITTACEDVGGTEQLRQKVQETTPVSCGKSVKPMLEKMDRPRPPHDINPLVGRSYLKCYIGKECHMSLL